MVKVIFGERKSAVLKSSSLACLSDIPSVNLTSGCAHDCLYCYARGYSVFPGDHKVLIYANSLDKLKSELSRKKIKSQAVYFSPSSDFFQPIPEVLELSYSILEFLLSSGIGIAFLTKGEIPDKTLELLTSHAEKVRSQIGIITPDDNIRRIFEPNAANIDLRLEQMTRLVTGGIATEARVIPILPGITDTSDALHRLFSSIAKTGVTRASISTLFLRSAITKSIIQGVSDKNLRGNLLDCYKDTKRLPVQAEHSSVFPLLQSKRMEIYNRTREIAIEYGIHTAVCGCMNPDIGGTCNITGKWVLKDKQQRLFQ